MKTIRVFVSSPGDVLDERQRARAVIDRVGRRFAKEARVVPVLWEEAPLRATASFQAGIDEQVDLAKIDIVVFILWSRLGTPLGGKFAKDGRDPTGTEWEFEQAREAHRQRQTPDLLVYRRTSEPALPSIQKDPKGFEEAARQYRSVEGFFQRWFRGTDGSFTAAFHTYGAPDGFEQNFEKIADSAYVKVKYLPKNLAAQQARMGHFNPDLNVSDTGSFAMALSDVLPYSAKADAAIPVGTVIPSVLFDKPFGGDRGDVSAHAQWKEGWWTLEASRKLDTGSRFDQAIVDDTFMWVAVFDHNQVRHTRHMRPLRLHLE